MGRILRKLGRKLGIASQPLKSEPDAKKRVPWEAMKKKPVPVKPLDSAHRIPGTVSNHLAQERSALKRHAQALDMAQAEKTALQRAKERLKQVGGLFRRKRQ